MADLAQLTDAFKRADAAGDTRAATALAREVRRMQQEGSAAPVAQAPQDIGVLDIAADAGRNVLSAAGDAVGGAKDLFESLPLPPSMMYRAASAGVDYGLTGNPASWEAFKENPISGYGTTTATDRLAAAADKATGASEFTKQQIPAGTTIPIDALNAGARALGGSIPFGGVSSPINAARTVAGSIGAGLANYGAQSAGVKDPWGLLGAEIAGELAAGNAQGVIRGLKKAWQKSPEMAREAIDRLKFSSDTVPETIRREVAQNIDMQARGGDPDAVGVLDLLKGATETRGTTSGRVGEVDPAAGKRLAALEEATLSSPGTPARRKALAQSLAAEREAATDQGFQRIEDVAAGGDPGRASAGVQSTVTGAQKRLDTARDAGRSEAAQLLQRARAAEQNVLRQGMAYPDPEEAGRLVGKTVDDAIDAKRATERAAWQEDLPRDVDIPTTGLWGEVNKFLDGDALDNVTSTNFRKRYAPELKELQEDLAKGQGNARDLLGRVQALRDDISNRAYKKEGGSRDDFILQEISKRIDARLQADPQFSAPLAKAREATVARAEVFEDATGAAVKTTERQSAPVLAQQLVKTGVRGAAVDDALAKVPELRDTLPDALRAEFETVLNPGGAGVPKVTPATTWLIKRRELFDRFSDVRDELQGRLDTLRVSASEVERSGALGKSVEATRDARRARVAESEAAKFGGFEPELAAAAAREVINNKTMPSRAAAQVMAAARKAGPEAVTNVKAAFRKNLVESLRGSTTPMKDFEKALGPYSKVLSPGEIDEVRKGLSQVERAQPGSLEKIFGDTATREVSPLTTIKMLGARLGGANLASNLTRNSLIGANLASKATETAFRRLPDAQFQRAMVSFLEDPSELRSVLEAMAAATTPAQATAAFEELMNSLRLAGSTAAATEQRERK